MEEGEDAGFEVQVMNTDLINGAVTVTLAVAIRVPGEGVIELYREAGKNLYNGEALGALPRTLADGTMIENKVGGRVSDVTVTIPLVGVVHWDGNHLIEVQVTAAMAGKTCGLCGNNDNVIADDMELAQADGYHILDVENTMFSASKMGTCVDGDDVDKNPCEIHPDRVAAGEKFCERIQNPEGPYAACHAFVDPKGYYESCVFDVCGNGKEAACSSVELYEKKCLEYLALPASSLAVDECGVCFGDGTTCGKKCSAW